ERSLGELVAKGRARCDAFAGLRRMLHRPHGRRERRLKEQSMPHAGRWTLIPSEIETAPAHERMEAIAGVLLKRYGVVFRKLLENERLPPWRDLLMALRRMEARGEIRGGRFVHGFSGKQFALPEAVGRLREIRRLPAEGKQVWLSAADPLNLTGI